MKDLIEMCVIYFVFWLCEELVYDGVSEVVVDEFVHCQSSLIKSCLVLKEINKAR